MAKVKLTDKEKIIVDLFKSLRTQQKITQTEIAWHSDFKTQSTYNHKENGNSHFSIDEMFKIMDILGVSMTLNYDSVERDQDGKKVFIKKEIKL